MFKIASKIKCANSIEFIKGADGEDMIWKTEEEAKEQIRLLAICRKLCPQIPLVLVEPL